jgi:hypothetical protein
MIPTARPGNLSVVSQGSGGAGGKPACRAVLRLSPYMCCSAIFPSRNVVKTMPVISRCLPVDGSWVPSGRIQGPVFVATS